MASKITEFALQESPFIELNKLLKITGVIYSGGEAKMLIRGNEVSVNGEIEQRLRRKCRPGDIVEVGEYSIHLSK
ncbi:MAG: RNA-binding S4 domain-containing protein [Bacteroidota bacterium]